MTTLLYIHGFLSSPLSKKAQITQYWLERHHPEARFHCPQLSSYPAQAKVTLLDLVNSISNEKIVAIGSSLGGFWASYLIEHGLIERAVLVNPGVLPQSRFQEFVGQTLKSYYSEDIFTLTQQDVDVLAAADVVSIKHPEKYWLLVQTGDETLDYRLAVEKYRHCRQTVERGGSHTFEGYENWLPDIAEFLLN